MLSKHLKQWRTARSGVSGDGRTVRVVGAVKAVGARGIGRWVEAVWAVRGA